MTASSSSSSSSSIKRKMAKGFGIVLFGFGVLFLATLPPAMLSGSMSLEAMARIVIVEGVIISAGLALWYVGSSSSSTRKEEVEELK